MWGAWKTSLPDTQQNEKQTEYPLAFMVSSEKWGNKENSMCKSGEANPELHLESTFLKLKPAEPYIDRNIYIVILMNWWSLSRDFWRNFWGLQSYRVLTLSQVLSIETLPDSQGEELREFPSGKGRVTIETVLLNRSLPSRVISVITSGKGHLSSLQPCSNLLVSLSDGELGEWEVMKKHLCMLQPRDTDPLKD